MLNLINKKFNKLIGIKPVGKTKDDKIIWLFKCDCGNFKEIIGVSVKNGKIKSCGCLRKIGGNLKHGHRKKNKTSKTYRAWEDMLSRCNNLNHLNYKNYGGRGIKVCKRWMKFENFLADIGEIPKGLTLDRIDNNGNYESNNCKFSSWKEQANNKRKRKIKCSTKK